MPAAERSVRLTDAYRTRVASLRRASIAVVAGLWTLEVDRLEATFAVWLARSELVLTTAQAQIARSADAYAAAFVGSELGRAVAPLGIDPAAYAGQAIDGRSLRSLLAPTLFTVKRGIGEGRPFDEASSLGRARALRDATTQVDDAGDQALDDVLEERDEIRGWRRVASGGACGACLASMTGAVHETARLLERHPHCRCTKEPVVAGVDDRIRRPTGAEMFERLSTEEQNRLFAGRGGEAKAELIRSGAVDFADLYSETRFSLPGSTGSRIVRPPAIVTETPLAELRAIAAARSL